MADNPTPTQEVERTYAIWDRQEDRIEEFEKANTSQKHRIRELEAQLLAEEQKRGEVEEERDDFEGKWINADAYGGVAHSENEAMRKLLTTCPDCDGHGEGPEISEVSTVCKRCDGLGVIAGDKERAEAAVKPINLMRWLVTPPGGVVLDPFGGSGTTKCAGELEGIEVILIERKPEYVAICEARAAFWAQHRGKEVDEVLGLVNRSKSAAKNEESGQVSLLAAEGRRDATD